jgi:murein DD-endopeptidase MepM/ murein hydrolase activator NlpD
MFFIYVLLLLVLFFNYFLSAGQYIADISAQKQATGKPTASFQHQFWQSQCGTEGSLGFLWDQTHVNAMHLKRERYAPKVGHMEQHAHDRKTMRMHLVHPLVLDRAISFLVGPHQAQDDLLSLHPVSGQDHHESARSIRHRRPPLSKLAVVVCTLICSVGSAVVFIPASPSAASSGIGTDRTKVAQLEHQIADQGAKVQSLVGHYDQVSGQLTVIRDEIATQNARLVIDHRAKEKATDGLRGLAVNAYVSLATGESPGLAAFSNSANAQVLSEKQEYSNVANTRLDAAISAYQTADFDIDATEAKLKSKEAEVSTTLTSLSSSHQIAQSALNVDDATLGKLSSSLQSLVTQANEKHAEAEEQEEEKALASEQVNAPNPTNSSSVAPVTVHPSAGTYANPLRSINALSPERVDQGVDYSGFGPIYAIGDAVIISTYNGGWPGGTFISYRLSDGPEAGLVVYAAEDIEPQVQSGETVTASTVIGQMYEGPDGIETGWADPSGDGTTEATDSGQFDGSNSTAFGYNFSQLLESLGAPGGILQNNPPTGSVPAGF